MYQYLRLIPFGMIYIVFFFTIIPRIEGKGAKFIMILILIPIAYFLSGYVDQYIPRLLNRFSNYINF